MNKTESMMTRSSLGLVRVAAISPALRVADVTGNVAAIVAALEEAATQGVQLALFPELCLTGYSCGDLFMQTRLHEAAAVGLAEIAAATARLDLVAVAGLPVPVDGRLYNCAAFLAGGRIIGVVPKIFLPNYNEFYEARWFRPGDETQATAIDLAGQMEVPFGVDLLFSAANFARCTVGIEICEDLWAVIPPSGDMALSGASLLLNLSAGNELLAKADYRRELVSQQSARCLAAYLYAGAGAGESTTDTVWSGHSLIAENGRILAETERFHFTTQIAIADMDLMQLEHERLNNTTFGAQQPERAFRRISFTLPRTDEAAPAALLNRHIPRTPFVPGDPRARARHCREIFSIQSLGLVNRLKHIGLTHVTIGVSGGLDSTLALLVTVKAFDLLGLDRAGIVAVTMPGFGTTQRTRGNAEKLAELLGVTLRIIPIHAAVRQHFQDIGHDENVHDVTYENAQARERTQILMDLGNQVGGLNVGTGDLSELALGWATYNGDHMSMYHVNAGVPKTLVRYLVEWAAESEFSGAATQVLMDISATPITPELLPLGEDDELEQKTEESIGPYELHDFFLFYAIRYAFPPRKVYYLARLTFAGVYDADVILRWLRTFYRRFFANQFKRSAMPDGPKVGSVALSPRADWRMPSDAVSRVWLDEVEALSL
ncbi:MAG: NAD(+) synthase [Caldilineaceae bacterium]|nr:NAD(+) synthase [Caldilineaceae bacterium]